MGWRMRQTPHPPPPSPLGPPRGRLLLSKQLCSLFFSHTLNHFRKGIIVKLYIYTLLSFSFPSFLTNTMRVSHFPLLSVFFPPFCEPLTFFLFTASGKGAFEPRFSPWRELGSAIELFSPPLFSFLLQNIA